ncbi:MAG: M24 family metallopeptidase, partial [Chloroflexi bacterium]|nr:M24 family metallopeptidase [Chloroflexota bacterium]
MPSAGSRAALCNPCASQGPGLVHPQRGGYTRPNRKENDLAIIVKSAGELAIMREAGRINALALEAAVSAVRVGVTTRELDAIAEDVIRSHGATPAFLGYPNRSYPAHPYPATINASIDGELVHGIPGGRRLREGQILSIDCGTVFKGYVGDSAVTVPVGRVSPEAERLLEVTREAL